MISASEKSFRDELEEVGFSLELVSILKIRLFRLYIVIHAAAYKIIIPDYQI